MRYDDLWKRFGTEDNPLMSGLYALCFSQEQLEVRRDTLLSVLRLVGAGIGTYGERIVIDLPNGLPEAKTNLLAYELSICNRALLLLSPPYAINGTYD